MSFEAALTTFIKAEPGIVALASTRFYPLDLPAGCPLPALTYQIMTGRELHMANYVEPVVLLTSWARDHADVIALDAAVRAALEGFHDLMGAIHVRCQVGAPSDSHDLDTGLYARRRVAQPLFRHP